MARWLASQPPPAAKGQTRAPYKPGQAPPLREAQAQINAHAKQLAAAPQGENARTRPTPRPRRPATPIVTEHTRGQAHGGAANYGTAQARAGLPQDQGVAPHPGLNPRDVKDLGVISASSVPILQRGLGNLVQDAFYTPAGIYTAGRAVAHDVGQAAEGHLGFTHSRAIGLEMARQMLASVEHPERRPGDTVLNLAGAAGLVGGTAARLGAVGEEGSAAAFLRKPVTKPRAFTVGEKRVDLLPSNNPAFRALQEVHDRIVQRAVAERPNSRLARYGNWRLGNALSETRKYVQEMHAAPSHVLARAGKKLTAEEQAALRLTAEQATPAERIAVAEKQAAAGVNPEAQARQIKLLGALAKDGLVAEENGRIVVNGASPKLAVVDRMLARAGTSIDKIVTDTGQMTEEALASRRTRPNLIAATGMTTDQFEALTAAQKALLEQHHENDLANLRGETRRANRTAAQTSAARAKTAKLSTRMTALRERLAAENATLGRMMDEGYVAAPGRATAASEAIPLVRQQSLVERLQKQYDRAANAHFKHQANGGGTAEALGESMAAEQARLTAAHEQAVVEHYAALHKVQPPDVRPGRQYVPYYASEPRGGLTGIAKGSRGVTGRPRPPISATQHFTGASQLAGHVPDNTTGLVARQWQRQIRYAATNTFRREIAKAGSDVRRTPRDVLVNTQELKNATVPDEIRVLLGSKVSTLDELKPAQTAFENWRQRIFPGDMGHAVGEAAPEGYRWVDRGLLGDLGQPGPLPVGKFGRTVDTINSAQTLATVYLKPGHIATRAVTNAVANLLQGSLRPTRISRSARIWRDLTHEERVAALGAAGEAGVHALPAESANVIGRSARAGAGWWAKHIDAPFRLNSLVYEANRVGIRTTDEFRQMLHDMTHQENLTPERAAIIDRVAKNANREAISYDRLSPFEKQYLRRLIWFYPWIKGATIFAGRTVLEHPIKTAVAANVAQVGQKQAQADLGPVPFYEDGLFKVGGSKAFPLTVNPATLHPFTTPAETGATIGAALSGKWAQAANLAGSATPAAGILLALATGRDPESGTQLKGNALQAALAYIEKSNPEASLYRRLTQDPTGKLFPVTRAQSAEQILLGSESPKKTSQAVLTGQAASEFPIGPRTKANWQAKLTQLGVTEPDPRITAAINADAARTAARAKRPKTTHGRLQGDLDALVTLGEITPALRAETMAYANTLSEYSLAQRVAKIHLGKRFDPYGVLSKINDAVAKKKGGG